MILWEYSLNEANYFAHGQSEQVLLHHTAWLFELCARRGYRVLPVLLYNRAEAEGSECNAYRPLLTELLVRRGLTGLDAQDLWRRDFAHLPVSRLYKDNPHYATDTGFPAALAWSALERAVTAPVPRPDPAAFSGRDLSIAVPSGIDHVPFANRILSCNIFPLRTALHVPLTGRLLACYLIASAQEPAMSFRTDDESRGPYSARISPREEGPLRQLKHLLPWSSQIPPLRVRGDLVITIDAKPASKPIVQHTMAWQSGAAPGGTAGAASGGLIGLLAEAHA
ncbi:hypothetical protein ORIO_19745 (plasmid) [Cereibacter azotoformans]|uniref:hypothetical protein n=1 Tax=Cereibacter azotoformans TaxID=43057 RepID=UPI001EEA4700|nr:hypothetical protein [Cereibacter azotoformans]ULB12052.1 hypothetical protein ORIO_19745 [Cereibacter azotoformans]